MSITYQQAKRIRKTGIMGLFADQLMYEKKVSTAIKKTISLKSRGTMMGITQYLDPLNIAKMLTFGSALGPALLGHFMKRDARDIQYFTGRLKPIRERDTSSKLSKMPSAGTDDISSAPTLLKIYNLLDTTHQENVKRRELAKSREEELQLEDERRHKELLKALGTRQTATPIKEKDKKENGVSSLLKSIGKGMESALSGLKTFLMGMIGSALSGINDAIGGLSKLTEWVTNLLNKIGLKTILYITRLFSAVAVISRILASPLFLAVIGSAAAVYGVKKAMDAYLKSQSHFQTQIERTDREIASATQKRNEIAKEYGPNDVKTLIAEDKIKALQNDREQFTNKLNAAKQQAENEKINGKPPSFFDKMIGDLKSSLDFKDLDFKIPEIPNFPAMPTLEANLDTGEVSLSPVGQETTTPPQPMPSVGPTAALNKVNTDNLDTKMQEQVQRSSPQPAQVNNSTNINQSVETAAEKRSVPPVRSRCPTFGACTLENTIFLD